MSGQTMVHVRKLLRASCSSEWAVAIYDAAFRRVLPQGHSIFITSMPKSGSTFLWAALRNVTGYRNGILAYAFGQNEQQPYVPRLVDNRSRNSVTRHHVHATDENIELLREFGIAPVIVTRNIFDVVVSVRDHLLREGLCTFPGLYPPADFRDMSDAEQLSFLVAYAVPWYLQFYVGWYDVWRWQRLETHWLTYEELVSDWPGGVHRVLAFNGIHKTREEIRPAVQGAYGEENAARRMNKAVTGRGRQQLSSRQRERILKIAQSYTDVDFSPLGLPSRSTAIADAPVASPA